MNELMLVRVAEFRRSEAVEENPGLRKWSGDEINPRDQIILEPPNFSLERHDRTTKLFS